MPEITNAIEGNELSVLKAGLNHTAMEANLTSLT